MARSVRGSMVPANDVPLKVRFVMRTLPRVETPEGSYVVEPAILPRETGECHCIVAHPERANANGRFEVVQLSADFGSYQQLLRGYCCGFEIKSHPPGDQARVSSILRRLLDLRVAEIVG